MDDEKVCTLPQVRGGEGRGDEPGEVEVWRDGKSGRLVMRAYNQGGHDCVDIDLRDVIDWLAQITPAESALISAGVKP